MIRDTDGICKLFYCKYGVHSHEPWDKNTTLRTRYSKHTTRPEHRWSAGAPRLLWLAPNASMHEPSSSAAGEMKPPDLNLTETVLNSGIMRRRGLLARHRPATRSCCLRTGFRRILFSSIVQRSVEVPELHFLQLINGLAFIRHAQNF